MPSSLAPAAASPSSRIPRPQASPSAGARAPSLLEEGGTPSRLAQFRARNWRKRVLEAPATAAGLPPPPKRRAVTSLFAEDTAAAAASQEQEQEQEQPTEQQEGDAKAEVTTVVPPPLPLSDEDAQLVLQQEIRVGRCLAHELSRDNARLKLKVDGLRDDIDYFYELLAKIEAVAQAAGASRAGQDTAADRLAEAVKRIISAPKQHKTGEHEESP